MNTNQTYVTKLIELRSGYRTWLKEARLMKPSKTTTAKTISWLMSWIGQRIKEIDREISQAFADQARAARARKK